MAVVRFDERISLVRGLRKSPFEVPRVLGFNPDEGMKKMLRCWCRWRDLNPHVKNTVHYGSKSAIRSGFTPCCTDFMIILCSAIGLNRLTRAL